LLNNILKIYVKLRPYLVKALKSLKKDFEMILFTAASDQWAELVLSSFGGQQFFDHILCRKQCLNIY
jgi:TFIIF-interacting CTD phosphatase-like protein